MASTNDPMPISNDTHPSNRSDSGMTEGDTVPAPPAPQERLYAVSAYVRDGQHGVKAGLRLPELYLSAAAANVAARKMLDKYAEMLTEPGGAEDPAFEHNGECGGVGLYSGRLVRKGTRDAVVEIMVFVVGWPEGAGPAGKTGEGRREDGKGSEVKTESRDDDDGEDDDEEEEEEDDDGGEKPAPRRSRRLPSRTKTPARTAVQTSTYRKKIPEGKPGCLRGLKVLFTGTFETMDRRTSIATAVRYGAEVVAKLEETDYVVVGLRAGPKKLREINEKELETIGEEEFFRILEDGVSKEKRKRMAARRRADQEARGHAEEGSGGDEEAARGNGRRKRAKR